MVDQATATLLSSKIKVTYKSSIAPDTVVTVELFNNTTLSEKAMTSKVCHPPWHGLSPNEC